MTRTLPPTVAAYLRALLRALLRRFRHVGQALDVARTWRLQSAWADGVSVGVAVGRGEQG